jgi:hypothetical protein
MILEQSSKDGWHHPMQSDEACSAKSQSRMGIIGFTPSSSIFIRVVFFAIQVAMKNQGYTYMLVVDRSENQKMYSISNVYLQTRISLI